MPHSLENRLIDKFVPYMAPKLSGGKEAPTFLRRKRRRKDVGCSGRGASFCDVNR